MDDPCKGIVLQTYAEVALSIAAAMISSVNNAMAKHSSGIEKFCEAGALVSSVNNAMAKHSFGLRIAWLG